MAGKEKKTSSVLRTTADDYAEGATVHGVGYIFNELLPDVDRVIWALSVMFFFILAVFFTTNVYTDWQDNLVITTLKNTAKDVTELPFPAVTICSEGLNMETVSKALARSVLMIFHVTINLHVFPSPELHHVLFQLLPMFEIIHILQ